MRRAQQFVPPPPDTAIRHRARDGTLIPAKRLRDRAEALMDRRHRAGAGHWSSFRERS